MRQNYYFPNGQNFNLLTKAEKIHLLVQAASLAPSTVNTQPWLLNLKNNAIELFLNSTRILPVTDSTKRQAYISLGASFANMELLAQSYGLKISIDEFKEASSEHPIAQLSIENFISTEDHSEIRRAILNRHTNRFPFEKRSLPQSFTKKIKSFSEASIIVQIVEDEKTKNKITPLILQAIFEVFSKKDWSYEMSQWIKPSLAKYEDGMPGYYLGIPKLLSFLMPFILRHTSVAKIQTRKHAAMLNSVSAYGIISSSEDSPNRWFRVGKIFEHIAIEAEISNIKIGILTAPTEIQTYAQQIKKILNSDQVPQMLFRIGYANKKPQFSPRLSINKILKA
jgi:hypothetical protein